MLGPWDQVSARLGLHVFAKKAGVGRQPLPYTQPQGPFLLLHCHARLLGLQPQDLRGGLCVPEGSCQLVPLAGWAQGQVAHLLPVLSVCTLGCAEGSEVAAIN